MLLRAIISAIIFYFVYYWLRRLFDPRQREHRARAHRSRDAADKYPDAIEAEFEELDKK